MNELLEALDAATNVKTVTYDNETKEWTVTYKNGLNPDKMPSEVLIDFLNNG